MENLQINLVKSTRLALQREQRIEELETELSLAASAMASGSQTTHRWFRVSKEGKREPLDAKTNSYTAVKADVGHILVHETEQKTTGPADGFARPNASSARYSLLVVLFLA